MNDLEYRISEIKSKIDNVIQKRAERQHKLSVAEDIKNKALQTLKDEFNITNIDAVPEMLLDLEKELSAAVEEVEKELRIANDC